MTYFEQTPGDEAHKEMEKKKKNLIGARRASSALVERVSEVIHEM